MTAKMPDIKIPFSKAEWIIHILGLMGIVYIIVLFFTEYIGLPATIPTHWNFSGEIDGYGGKSTLLVLAAIGIIMYIGLTILGHFPKIFNFPVEVTEKNAYKLYYISRAWLAVINTEMMWIFSYIFFASIRGAQGREMYMMPVMLILVGLMIVSCIVMVVRLLKAGKEEE